MNCGQCSALLLDYVMRETSASDAEMVSEHLTQCAACQREFYELQHDLEATFEAMLPSQESLKPISAEECQRIVETVVSRTNDNSPSDAPRQRVVTDRELTEPPTRAYRWRLLARHGLAAAAGLLLSLAWFQPELPGWFQSAESNARTFPTEDTRGSVIQIAADTLAVDSNLKTTIVYDISSREMHFYGVRLKPLPLGQRYVLRVPNIDGSASTTHALRMSDGVGVVTIQGIEATQAANCRLEVEVSPLRANEKGGTSA